MGSVFKLLDEIRKRPTMYLGRDESQRLCQLKDLETMLHGYSLALHQHGIQEPGLDFTREFAHYLWRQKSWSASCGPVAAVRDAVKTDEEAWELFWRLIDDFRATFDND